ncbi:2-keto-4-pentenoate hydratase [Halopseudomonas bauzanensis]|uniref:2-keto-4-pentenoate hydratase n=1 Tax=Halopseudomonas bauzanensis TaxID=653930 RepID=A0A1H9QD59_9GAMM|nr:fumarylacetoacetate hydrolase family protein [Halopseudomonas bauzanensis]SER58105.1 2-keto-4-pentenoate hydratase [Halopseudomonas bauzanensis]SFL67315.1 2-keto-4-pentenoate hydratase [Halopseudomonas bauzanensis]
MSEDFQPNALADELYLARRQRQPGVGLAERYPLATLEQAQQVSECLITRYLADGQTIAGSKLGLTDTRMQAALGLDSPLIATLLSGWQVNGGSLDISQFLLPKLEMEVAFLFSAAIDDPEITDVALQQAISGVTVALEICDSAYQGGPRSLFEAVADNLSSGGFMLGEQYHPADPLALTELSATLTNHGKPIAEGNASQCMGSPWNACRWLVQERARDGNPVQAGEILLSGSLGPMVPIQAGDRLELEMGYLGRLGCAVV